MVRLIYSLMSFLAAFVDMSTYLYFRARSPRRRPHAPPTAIRPREGAANTLGTASHNHFHSREAGGRWRYCEHDISPCKCTQPELGKDWCWYAGYTGVICELDQVCGIDGISRIGSENERIGCAGIDDIFSHSSSHVQSPVAYIINCTTSVTCVTFAISGFPDLQSGVPGTQITIPSLAGVPSIPRIQGDAFNCVQYEQCRE
jgi:hypothetical protein